MFRIKRVSLLAGAASLTLTGASFADTNSQATNDELWARTSELESRLAAVEARGSEDWLTEKRADEIKSLVQDVLADADTRSGMLNQGMTAGYDDGFVISSADGNWLLRTNFQLQTRFIFNSHDINSTTFGPPPGAIGGKRNLWSFEVPRARFILSGNVVSPEWFYYVDINVAPAQAGAGGFPASFPVVGVAGGIPADVRAGLLEAYAGYDFGNGFSLYAGTFKDPFVREDIIDSRYQLAVERSLTSYFFTTGFTDGIALTYEADTWRATLAYGDGSRQGGTVYTAADADLSFTLRGEWLAAGTWDQFIDFTSPRGEELGVLLGGAIHWQSSGVGTAGTYNNMIGYTMEGQAEFGGGSLFGAFIFNNVNNNLASGLRQFAVVINGGYYITDTWEVFGQYQWLEPSLALVPDFNIFTVGVNGYFAGHNAKWTTDLGIANEGIRTFEFGAGAVPAITGWRADGFGADTQLLVRTQLQIAF